MDSQTEALQTRSIGRGVVGAKPSQEANFDSSRIWNRRRLSCCEARQIGKFNPVPNQPACATCLLTFTHATYLLPHFTWPFEAICIAWSGLGWEITNVSEGRAPVPCSESAVHKLRACLEAGGACAAIIQDTLSGGNAWFASYDQKYKMYFSVRCREEMHFFFKKTTTETLENKKPLEELCVSTQELVSKLRSGDMSRSFSPAAIVFTETLGGVLAFCCSACYYKWCLFVHSPNCSSYLFYAFIV